MVLCLDPWLTGIPYIYLINNYWIFGNENFVPSLHFCERYSNTMVAGEFVASAILFGYLFLCTFLNLFSIMSIAEMKSYSTKIINGIAGINIDKVFL